MAVFTDGLLRQNKQMVRRPQKAWILVSIFCAAVGTVGALSPNRYGEHGVAAPFMRLSNQNEGNLSTLLGQAADYCDTLSRAVLDFVCRENIEEWFYTKWEKVNMLAGSVFTDGRIERYEYLYDYQLVHDRAGHLGENRTLIKEQGKNTEISNAPLKTHIFKYAYVIRGPLGLLGRDRQADFTYKIVREEKAIGETAVVIEAVPKAGVHPDYLFGTIWLRKKDAGILKIQWNPASMENYAGVENVGRLLNMKPDVLMTSEYAFEKNGIRFPSRYNIKERYLGKLGRSFQRSETDVTYDQYKFFSVETDVIYSK